VASGTLESAQKNPSCFISPGILMAQSNKLPNLFDTIFSLHSCVQIEQINLQSIIRLEFYCDIPRRRRPCCCVNYCLISCAYALGLCSRAFVSWLTNIAVGFIIALLESIKLHQIWTTWKIMLSSQNRLLGNANSLVQAHSLLVVIDGVSMPLYL